MPNHFYKIDDTGLITEAADWEFPESSYSEEEILHGYDGKLYFKSRLPESVSEDTTNTARISEIFKALDTIDAKSARSLRAVVAGTATSEDRKALEALELQAQELREELSTLTTEATN